MSAHNVSTDTINLQYQRDTLLSQVFYLENKRVEPIPYTEEEAWERAKSGFQFPSYFEIGTLQYIDLLEISTYSPTVDLQTYKSLQLLNREQLLKKAPIIIYFHPAVTKADLFFYFTRGWLPYDINIAEKIERWNQFDQALSLNQDLLLLLYNTQKHFAELPIAQRYVNIDKVVFFYDAFVGMNTTAGILSEMAGIEVFLHSTDMNAYIYNKLHTYIQTAAVQTPFSEDESEVFTLDKVISVSKEVWDAFVTQNYPEQSIPYNTRSDFVMQQFYCLDCV